MIDAGQMTQEELAALLRWYEAMGVDAAVDDAPHDRFAEFADEAAKRSAAPRAAVSAPAPQEGRKPPLA
ncbi:MAG: uracil-DNA glycosylase, partial [Beijerinckiaceae bacterium]|nr:uracil-DNA glycosylase [Beijerinckiaceae bacterium]